jgi:DNA invertase Pin-like site-specific DNA recombinase
MNPKLEAHNLRSEKIQAVHLDRLAVVYVRQSTLQQVLEHQESTRLQYGMVDRAEALGWQPERVLVIDEDLGKSGATAVGRAGFQRLVAEVSLNHVGVILGVEMSRLARCSKDWHQLLEVCALFRTLIGDLDGIYDPSQYNDRLLLGLKGTMSEAELHVLKTRLLEGKLNKARRGELPFDPPIGYLRRPCGEVIFDPDEQAQQIVRLIFRKFDEIGTLNGVLRYLVRQGIQIGVRVREGSNRGDLEWRQPNRMTLQNLLKNPAYAGAYAYGRRQQDPRKHQPGRPKTGRVVSAPAEWHALVFDQFPAYISWEHYQQNLARLQANQVRAETIGAARHGAALLSGLLVCGYCKCRMTVHYSGQGRTHEYLCNRRLSDYAGKGCQHVSGLSLDSTVTQQVLQALQPATLELSLQASKQFEQERAELNQLWQQKLERATMEAERSGRHYRLIEPENRLVARQLAKEWEEKLATVQQMQEDYQRFCAQQPGELSEVQRSAIRQLAQDIPALWNATTTTNAHRKEIIRQLMGRIVVQAQGQSEQVKLSIEWTGGTQSEHEAVRPVASLEQLSYYPQLCQRVQNLVAQGFDAASIAIELNQAGFRPPRLQSGFSHQGVLELMRRLGLHQRRPKGYNKEPLGAGEWWIPDLARQVGMPDSTLYQWLKQGWIEGRQQENPPYRWIVRADDAEIERLKYCRQLSFGDRMRQQWRGEKSSLAPQQEDSVCN